MSTYATLLTSTPHLLRSANPIGELDAFIVTALLSGATHSCNFASKIWRFIEYKFRLDQLSM